ncbi:MAG: glycosyltransferase family 4 protein [Parcubacteria group bacterium]|jgi:glycosyltransferase involved in cell wall biosynthesis
MKIAFIGQKGIPVSSGGVERRVQELATRMAKLGHEVFVYARKNYASELISEYKGVKIIYLPCVETKNLGAITHTLIASLHAIFQKYDIVHYQAPGPSSLCWIMKLFNPSTGLVATFNSRDEKHQKWGRIARAYLRFGEFVINKVPDRTISVSKLIKEHSREKYGNEHITVIHNGSAIMPTNETDELDKWDLEKNHYFLTVARLVRHKGIHYLIEAFKSAKKKHALPENLKLAIVGDSAYTDDYVTYLKKIAEADADIIFTGSQSGASLAQLYANAFAFVLPSEAEGLSNVLLEAMGYGLAPIISSIPENTIVVEDNGLTFENSNASDLEKMLILAASNPENTKRLGLLAKQSVEKNYSWDENVSRTLKLYSALLQEKNSRRFIFQRKRLS